MSSRTGRILKGVAGVYDVLCASGVITVPAAGRFRNDGQTPLPGDLCEVEYDGANGVLTRLAERKNELVRPPLANVDTLIVTLAIHSPEPDWLLADKMICFCRERGITPLLCVNKRDLDEAGADAAARAYEACGIRAVSVSSGNEASVKELRRAIPSGVTCFCGQSAAGKSSLMNALLGERRFETGVLSKKTARGRHTTRRCELVRLSDGGFLADTPGFSLLEMPCIAPEEFRDLYEEYAPYAPACRFHGCFHDREPDCAVRQAVREGVFPEARYERYRTLLQEIREMWEKRYD